MEKERERQRRKKARQRKRKLEEQKQAKKEKREEKKKAQKEKRKNEAGALRKKKSRELARQANQKRLRGIRIEPTSSHRRSAERCMATVSSPVVLLLGMTSTLCPELEACKPGDLSANQIMEKLVALERQGHFSSERSGDDCLDKKSNSQMLFRDEARRMLASKLFGFHCIASANKHPGGNVSHANFYLCDFNTGIDFVGGLVRRYFPEDESKFTVHQVHLDHLVSTRV